MVNRPNGRYGQAAAPILYASSATASKASSGKTWLAWCRPHQLVPVLRLGPNGANGHPGTPRCPSF